MKQSLVRLSLLVVATACTASSTPTPDPPSTPPPSAPPPASPPPTSSIEPTLARTVVLSGLSNPWDLAVLADGTIFYTERCRGLSVRRPDGTSTRLFGTTGSSLVAPDFFCEGQSGMNGVALDPNFATNRTIYVYAPSNLTTPRANRVVRLVLDAGYATASNRTDIVTGIAFKNLASDNGGSGSHSGGRIRFGPDGFLYIGTGDNHNGQVPQSPTSLGGKVLRVDRNGAAAAGNNAPSGFDARIYTYGHRNVQGITFRPGSGQPFSAEHGPGHNDEVTALVAGGNGGWDPQNRAFNCADNYCGYSGNATAMPMTDLARFPSAMRPSWSNNAASQGMGPATFLTGAQWRAWEGRLLVGIMGAQRTDLLTLDTAGLTTSVRSSVLPSARVRSLTQGADGNLWVSTDSGEIWRVTPS